MAPRGGILAIDLGTVLGYCAAMPGAPLVYGSYRLTSDRGDGAFFASFRRWLLNHATLFDPRLIAYEAAIITGHRTSFRTASRLIGLVAHTVEIAYLREIEAMAVNNSTAKKFMTGNGRAEKPEMQAAALALGHSPEEHNAADAIAIFLYAESLKAPLVRRSAGPLFAIAGNA